MVFKFGLVNFFRGYGGESGRGEGSSRSDFGFFFFWLIKVIDFGFLIYWVFLYDGKESFVVLGIIKLVGIGLVFLF